jgi:hypothetical protein
MNALFYQKLHGLTTLYTGFVFMGMAGVMLISQLTLKPLLKSYLGWSAISCVVFGGCMQGIGLLCVGQSGSLVYHLTCGYVAQLGGTIVTSQASSIVATFTDVSNRGKIFGAMQTYQNFGKIVGPVVATHIAMNGFLGIGMPGGFLGDTIAVWEDADDVHPFGLPFVLSGCLYLIAQAFVFVVKSRLDKQENKPKPRLTGYGEDWHDETGGPEDIERMGLFMAKLLQERHYKWVSQQDQVQQFLTDLVPEMDVNNKEAYQQCFELSQQKAQHN